MTKLQYKTVTMRNPNRGRQDVLTHIVIFPSRGRVQRNCFKNASDFPRMKLKHTMLKGKILAIYLKTYSNIKNESKWTK